MSGVRRSSRSMGNPPREIWGDMGRYAGRFIGRYGEVWGGVERCGVGRYGEAWGGVARYAEIMAGA